MDIKTVAPEGDEEAFPKELLMTAYIKDDNYTIVLVNNSTSKAFETKLDRMYYGNNKTTARNIGFDDSFIYDEIALKLANRKLPPEILLHNEEIKVFEAWTQKEGKTGY